MNQGLIGWSTNTPHILNARSATLAADVTLTSLQTWISVLTISLDVGVWFVTGTALFMSTVTGYYGVRLNDGTTTWGVSGTTSATNSYPYSATVSALITVTAPVTLTLAGNTNANTSTLVKAATVSPLLPATSPATFMQAFRVG